ncbi:MAG TPA: xanthine phosphoribosyltransferase [Anaerolineae bacterium]|nr:xanthine phosphoribosyltransferase [Anaerolineae bacterium]
MNILKQRILAEGRNMGRGILKVDSFLNHQVDPTLMHTCAQEFARRFRSQNPTRVLTAEISGIAPAVLTALELGISVVYARKHKPITMPDAVFLTTAPSHTKGIDVNLMVSPEYLSAGERVLIIDDFLATGHTILGLVRLAQAAGSTVVGIGAVIEKTFEGGREALSPLGVPIESLAVITDMSAGKIVFQE